MIIHYAPPPKPVEYLTTATAIIKHKEKHFPKFDFIYPLTSSITMSLEDAPYHFFSDAKTFNILHKSTNEMVKVSGNDLQILKIWDFNDEGLQFMLDNNISF
ncbi:MAG: hypothetical protein KC505_10820 [Myxococcales bacterium]|nr:hypothetical protein [Myxococcales bacterium]USN51541.1 MAG: hypothetical protein H6731_03800 [Myxococcales bacterium]